MKSSGLRLASFSWDETARATVAAYKELCASAARPARRA